MATQLTSRAKEGGTYGIRADFIEKTTDGEPGVPITPKTGLKWSLSDKDGNLINEREDVSLAPASSVFIVLSGPDLAVDSDAEVRRYVTITGTYDSVLGAGIVFVDEVSFQIENLVGKP